MISPNSGGRYPVISYSQPGAEFYACVIPAIDVVKRLEIKRRSSDPLSGIQRDESPLRLSEIARYAEESSAVFPTPIIVAASSSVVSIESGSIVLPRGAVSVGHILDGQHRVLGLSKCTDSVLAEFNLLVVFVFDIDTYSEASIFATINGNQKQVSKSLMYDLFALEPGRSIKKTCHEIVRSLNDDEASPFYRRIKVLGRKLGPQETLSQAAFVDQVSRQVADRNGVLYGYFISEKDWVIRKVVSNMFSAIEVAWSAVDSKYPEDYFFKTTGFGGVIQMLGDLAAVGFEDGDMSQSFFEKIFVTFFSQDATPPDGVGNKAMLEIRRRLAVAANLPD